MKKLFLLLLLSLMFSSCGTGVMDNVASGKPYEVFVVAPKAVWNGVVGDTLRNTFGEEVEWVNQPEPIFDLFSITPAALNNISRVHRNLFIINIDPKVDSTVFSVREDVWASGQVVMDLVGPSDRSIADYWGENGQTITKWLSNVERDRMDKRARQYDEPKLEQMIAEKFGLDINIPRGYTLNNQGENFIWISYEMKLASQGLIIYSFPKSDSLDLVAERNRAVKAVPGPSDGSYMATDTSYFLPEVRGFEINGRQWAEIRGFWNVKGDFMGGPFINYTTFDKATGRYIAIDMYVSSPSPKYPKRNYIRQLEAIMMSAKIK